MEIYLSECTMSVSSQDVLQSPGWKMLLVAEANNKGLSPSLMSFSKHYNITSTATPK